MLVTPNALSAVSVRELYLASLTCEVLANRRFGSWEDTDAAINLPQPSVAILL